ncbi:MAG: hypothetical protein BWZ08_00285 [candidate division BRC1 bacterium ADurb.BinA292]|nr:MAG: hypothetical protein BWZ08_00285 [candidate division BRC1 bacterium ADurb.BinA292]
MKRYLILALVLVLGGASKSYGLAFFEDFKDNGANFGPHSLVGGADGVDYVVTAGPELYEVLSTNGHTDGTTSWAVEYPAEGTITWDVSQHRYMQVYIPWKGGGGDLCSFQVQVDGDSTWVGDWWVTRIDNAQQWYHTQPTLVDVLSSSFGLGLTGVHELRFRFVTWSTSYDAQATIATVGMSMDWIRAGMAPSANIDIAKWSANYPSAAGDATPHVCGFVGPTDGAITANPPTLEWTEPEGFSNLTYTVTYSQDQWFRGPTTVTTHGVTGTSFTPPAMLDEGTWYWTVIPVNSDGIAGQDMFKQMLQYWNTTTDYVFYSFQVIGPNDAQHWTVY